MTALPGSSRVRTRFLVLQPGSRSKPGGPQQSVLRPRVVALSVIYLVTGAFSRTGWAWLRRTAGTWAVARR